MGAIDATVGLRAANMKFVLETFERPGDYDLGEAGMLGESGTIGFLNSG